MRIVCTLNDQKKARTLSSFLASENIENQLEINTITDWGSPDYGDIVCKIWVIEEDQISKAMHWIEEFQKNPDNPIFQSPSIKGPLTAAPPPLPGANDTAVKIVKLTRRPPQVVDPQPLGNLTLYLLLICCVLFAISELTSPPLEKIPASIPAIPVFSAPIKKKLFYDYPQAFEIIDNIVSLYGVESLQAPEDLPVEGKLLLEQYYQTPFWHGLYQKLVNWLQKPDYQWHFRSQLFEKIRQGEVWRLFSSCLLHNDLLHLFFNMIWLVVLGKQIEQRMGMLRYLVFIIITGIASNTAQYMMSGANFIGFSGILCAMLTFIWIRQRRAAWEGYQLQGVTMAFMMFFILTMFFIQVVSFSLETYQGFSISPGIANTSHLSGAILGYFLGRFNFFSWKT